jgi:hypothetical protein
MSSRELERVEGMGRVGSKQLKLTDAPAMLQLSYWQVKRLWCRYQQVGGKGLQRGNAGRASNRSKAEKFRRNVLGLVKKKCLVSRICGWFRVREVVLACDTGRFPSLHRCETHTIF